MIMSQPGTLPSGVKRKFSVGTDLAPTILAAAGMTTKDANGFDLYTPLREGKESPRICAVSTLYRSMALVTSKYKLMFFIDDGSCRLYDRIMDPAEQTDRSGDFRYDRVKQMMLEALLGWRCNLLDTGRIRRGSHLAGSVAKRVTAEMAQANTLESETTLQAKVAEIDLVSV